jgi:parallel beta-helix repeat protein
VSAGSATITATCDGKSSSLVLTVTGGEVLIRLGASIQASVDAAPAGTAFVLAAGTHRRQTIIPKVGDRFRGEPGAVLDGEGVTRYAVRGWDGARWVDNVEVRGLVITRYAPPTQDGAISVGNGPGDATVGWVIDGCEVSYATYYGVRIGDRMRLANSWIHHNGTLNVGGGGRAVLVENTEISYGNYLSANDPGFEAGGTKFVLTDSLVVRNNYIHDNVGPGLWTDTDNINTLLEGNRVERNTREGIVHEISYKAVIRNNVVKNNGWGDVFRPTPNWLWNAGIGVHASSDVEIYGNTLSGNFNGIVGVQQNRGSGRYGPYLVSNMNAHDNTVTQNQPMSAFPAFSANAAAGLVDDTNTNGAYSRNNRFTHNTYYLLPIAAGNSPGFEWLGGWRTDAQWRGYGHDATGTFNR